MATKCIKLAGEYAKENSLEKDKFFKELRDIQYKTWLACNRAITYFYSNDMQNLIQKDVGIPKEDDKTIFGKSFVAWVENRMNEIMEGISSANVAQTRQFVNNRYSQDKKNGLLKGSVSLSQFKRDLPIIIHNKAYNVIETSKGLGVEISFFNKEKQKELNVKRIKLLFPKLDNSSKQILIRLMDKTYKQGSIQVTYNRRKKKWMFAISYTFENKLEKVLDDNLVMGIDLGITKVATMSIYDIEKHEYKKMYFKEQTIDGTELIHYRQRIEARRKSLSIASKWASDNATGHGYKRRMKKANNIGDKYNRFKDTYNHKVSRYIVDLAYKHGVKTIQMEDLSGFSEHQSESLLKNWSYYDLQNKIKYKAEEKGINTIFINPQYTSKRCSKCGNIHEENRDCKNNQSKFECVVCGHKENADINASKNIAIPYIDKIIKEYIKDTK
ncbi:RNA-guided endonuclease TnpB family protein (plasmid) [Clostridium perfringens]|uniref:IS200/IS605 family element transposase accessory protein TnpB n=1 Tax=Clostridium perfringens TaxID=1502 RepID=A0A8H9UY18_CLOPF|nr:transposase [Clostridium perfringens]HAT4309047.1 IS200/IS605 family element transposase accessory protein TnpB [Clostridium perfringens]HBI6962801.1 transposase [Clostridium perfringens]